MEAGALHSRYQRWGRAPALALLAALVAAIILVSWTPASAPAPKLRTSPQQPSDLQLYRDIITGVEAGGDYYEVAAAEHRLGHYPLQPFFTVRLPTHATVYALAGERVMIGMLWLLCAGLMFAWWVRLRPLLPLPGLAAAMFLLAGGLGGMLQPMTGLFHESWVALLLALMIALWRPERPWPAMVAGGLALLVRELALPMILAMGGLALLARRWREAAGWALIVTLFSMYMTLHAQWVAEVVRPDDLTSPGWSETLGVQFALKSLAKVTFGIRMPDVLAMSALVLSLFGWASIKSGWALRATLLVLGYAALLALLARADTFYWALIPAPLAFVGLIFVPRALADLVKAARGMPQAFS
ncbi:hypothetical protein [Sphingomonas xanthus]|uniref:DUF2029 domain-containing protein n=1 Tax=Sphingomonas xanthus TaxID=2594473 RepID=A0A516IPF0_9SPHN|nr:hypothetical protein [Sphingomonas xanthus]QDP18802.1 hypothetical protein FMM02_01810 [Sphingomonas xanthus]